ncbi:MAG TPA: hypothetical protein EYP49_13160 [Anaerolineae bacterium]|nr:hypothetical protein [Anaerolineae bacterium]
MGNLPALWSKADLTSDLYVVMAHQDKIFAFYVSGPMAERVTSAEAKEKAYKILGSFTTLSTRQC